MASYKIAALAVIGLLAISSAFASEFEHDRVVNLTSKNYDEMVADGKVYFLKFYAPWCGHCKRLAPTWGDLASAVADNKDIVIGHVDCTVAREVCSAAEVKGYPTLKVIHNGEEFKAYRGGRDLQSLKSFIEDAASELKK